MSSLFNLALILFFFSAGYTTSRLLPVPASLPQRINKAVINFIFPAIILLNIPHLEFQAEYLFLLSAPWLVVGVTAVLLLAVRRHYGWSPEILCACLILAALGNTGNLGYPMLKSFFSDDQAAMGIIYDQLGTFIALCTYASILIAGFSGKGDLSALRILKRIFSFPPFVTLLTALVLPASWLTSEINAVLRVVSYSIIPLTMFSIGMQFRFSGSGETRLPLIWVLGLKMVLAPLLIFFTGQALHIPEEMLEVATFQAAMPPIVAGVVLLIAQGLASRFAVSALGFGTLIALGYLPLLAWVLQSI